MPSGVQVGVPALSMLAYVPTVTLSAATQPSRQAAAQRCMIASTWRQTLRVLTVSHTVSHLHATNLRI